MKKNLKKVTAIALAALTVTSMSSIAFAAQGDVDGDTILTANDAALTYTFVNDVAGTLKAKFSEKTLARIEKDGRVMADSVLSGTPTATDATKILEVVNRGGNFVSDFETALQEAIEDVVAGKTDSPLAQYVKVETDPETGEEVVVIDVPVKNADGTTSTKKVKKAKSALSNVTEVKDLVKEVEEATEFNDEIGEVATAFTFKYGDATVTVEADNDYDNVLTKLDKALNDDKTLIEGKANGLKAALEAFYVNGKNVDKDGWALIGAQIAADQTAFNALFPENVDDNYVASFVSNVQKAFPASNKDNALKNIESYQIRSTSDLKLTIDGKVIEEPKEALKTFVSTFLYADGTPAGYDFEELTLAFGGKNNLEVTKVKKA